MPFNTLASLFGGNNQEASDASHYLLSAGQSIPVNPQQYVASWAVESPKLPDKYIIGRITEVHPDYVTANSAMYLNKAVLITHFEPIEEEGYEDFLRIDFKIGYESWGAVGKFDFIE